MEARRRSDGLRYWQDSWNAFPSCPAALGVDVGRLVVRLEPGLVSVGGPPALPNYSFSQGFRLSYLEWPLSLGLRLGDLRPGRWNIVVAGGPSFAQRVDVSPGSGYVGYVSLGSAMSYQLSPKDIARLRSAWGARLSLTAERRDGRFAPMVGLQYVWGLSDLSSDKRNEVSARRADAYVGLAFRKQRRPNG